MTQFADWKAIGTHTKKSFGKLGKNHPKMLEAYGNLDEAINAEGLDAKTKELIAIAVAVTTRCESCIAVHTEKALAAGASDAEIAGALATAISLNAGATYAYALRAMEAVEQHKGE
ncbi:carboxymuconolactone decarboxylase family protein [Moraxella oblonga]|uniref:carboxymuconolactone decarboxylase family protein n=1 Tax=Moraxella oblonga TaxID=200413 RepID=UPI000835C957|nr:carboxymuconolactone decarboxylase family protein [Moraxella oblonga]